MAFFSDREKPEIKEEMRMRFCAPSFSFSYGEVLSLWTLAELRKKSSSLRGRIVILHPGLNTMLSPRHWMKEMGGAYYLVICSDKEDGCIEKLKKEGERIVYGLVARSLTGVSVCRTKEEAEEVVRTVILETGREAVTVNSTEGEL